MRAYRLLLLTMCALAGGLFAARFADAAEPALLAYVTEFGGDGVTVVDVRDGTVVAHVATGRKPHGVAATPSGDMVLVSNEADDTLAFIDPASNRVLAKLAVGGSPHQVATSADGSLAFVALNGDNAVAVVDVRQRRLLATIPVGRAPHILLRSPDGRRLYVTSEGDGKLTVLDSATWKPISEIPLFGYPRVVAAHPREQKLFQTVRWLNGALVVDLDRGAVTGRLALDASRFAAEGKDAHGIAVTPDGREIWLTTQTTGLVTVVGSDDLRVVAEIRVGSDPNWIELSPDGTVAVVSNTASNTLSILDVATRKEIRTVPVGPSPKRLTLVAPPAPTASAVRPQGDSR